MPFFFLPWPYEKVEFAKQILLWTLSGTAFLAWLGKMAIHDKEIRFKKDWFSIAVAIFTVVNLLVFIVSKDKYASLWGRFGRYSDSLLGLIAMVLLFYVIINNWGLFKGLIKTLLYGTFVGEVLLILSAYGWIGRVLAWIPGNVGTAFQQVMVPAFNSLGAFKGGAAMFLVVILILMVSVGARLYGCPACNDDHSNSDDNCRIPRRDDERRHDDTNDDEGGHKGAPLHNIIFLLLTLWCLMILNFPPAWILLIIMTIGIMGYRQIKMQGSVRGMIMPIIIVAVSVIFLFGIIGRSSVFSAIPNEARLSAKESLLITGRSLREGFAFGSGQGNFAYNFSKFKSQSFNDLDVWQLRFNKADNYITELLATTGILGLLAWMGLLGFVALVLINTNAERINTNHESDESGKNGQEQDNGLVISEHSFNISVYSLLAIILSQFFYSSTTLLLFTTWLLIIISVAPLLQNAQEIYVKKIFEDVPEILLAVNVLLGVIAILFVAFLINVSGKYRANVAFAKIANSETEYSANDKQAIIINATKLDKKNSLYPIALTRVYLTQIKEEIKKAPSQQSANLMRDLAEAVVNSAVMATKLSPNSVSAWELRGSVYRDIYSVVDEAESAMLSSFEIAIKLEPLNPILLTELGKAYILTGDNASAQEVLNKALELKSGYEEAKIQLAIVKDKTGMSDEAIGELEAISSRKPDDARIFFETGRIYFNSDNIEKAIENFKKSIQIFPEYSNALYSLALCYTKNGQKQEAINTFERVLELNPGSGDVKSKIDELSPMQNESTLITN